MKNLMEKLDLLQAHSAFTKIFYQIAAIVCIALAVLGISFTHIYTKDMTEEVTTGNFRTLQQNQADVDNEISRIEAMMLQIGRDRTVLKLLRMQNEDLNLEYEMVQNAIMNLNSFASTDDLIHKLWIHQKKADTILSAEGKMNCSAFYELNSPFVENLKLDEKLGQQGITFLGNNAVQNGLSETPVILFGTTLPMAESYVRGYLVVSLKASLFSERLAGDKKHTIFNYVFDENDQIIYTNENFYADTKEYAHVQKILEEHQNSFDEGTSVFSVRNGLGKRSFTVQSLHSVQTGWQFVSIIPNDVIYGRVQTMRLVTVLVIIISMLFCLIIVYSIFLRLNRPVQEILNYVRVLTPEDAKENRKQDKKESEFQQISRFISDVYSENSDLKESFRKARPIVTQRYLEDILNGRQKVDYSRQTLNEVGIHFPHQAFQVITCESSITDNNAYYYQATKNDIDQLLEAQAANVENAVVYLLPKSECEHIFLINAKDEFYEEDTINEFISNIRLVMEKMGRLYTIGVGATYRDVHDCYCSYVDSLRAARYREVRGHNTVIFVDEVMGAGAALIDYSIKTEMQLISETKTGKQKNVAMLINEVIDENLLEKPMISAEVADNLFQALLTTAVRVVYDLKLTIEDLFGEEAALYEQLREQMTLEEKRKFILSVFQTIVNYIDTKRVSKHGNIISRAIEYIGGHYGESLSLEIVAEEVNLSPAYFGFVFKEETGVSFVDYVNEYRVSEAKKLLLTEENTVTDISEKVGFGSYNRFVKVFKKYTGLTPSQFKSAQAEEQ